MKKKRTDFSPVVVFLIAALVYLYYHMHANANRLIIGMLIFASGLTILYVLIKNPIKVWYKKRYNKRYIYSMDKPIQKKQKTTEPAEEEKDGN